MVFVFIENNPLSYTLLQPNLLQINIWKSIFVVEALNLFDSIKYKIHITFHIPFDSLKWFNLNVENMKFHNFPVTCNIVRN